MFDPNDLYDEPRDKRCRDCAHRKDIRPRLPSLHTFCRVAGKRIGSLRHARRCLSFKPEVPAS
jgi:hypothetical protein